MYFSKKSFGVDVRGGGRASLGVHTRLHNPNHTGAFTIQLRIFSVLVHVAWCIGYSCLCLVVSIAQVVIFSLSIN
jgi:hypothetical protein